VSRTFEMLAVLGLACAGAWLRLRHLGDLGLIVDEGNQALAVRGLLEHGVPRVESGALYLRSPLFLGMQALLARLGGLDEFMLRLPSAIFGVLGIGAAYALARRLFDVRTALLAASILTFSVWEIELSRYGRFYSTFQFVFLLALLFFYRGFMLRETNFRYAFFGATAVAFALHEFSVLLAVCFAIPFASTRFSGRERAAMAVQGVFVAGAWALYRRMLTEISGASQAAQGTKLVQVDVGALETARVAFGIPRLRLPTESFLGVLHEELPWLLALVAAIALLATVYLVLRGLRHGEWLRIPLALLIVWAAFAHQFLIAGILWLSYVALFVRGVRGLGEPILRGVYVAVGACLIFWVAVLSLERELGSRELAMATFGFPNVLQYFLYWLVRGWPILTIVVAVGLAKLLLEHIKDRSAPMPIFVFGVLFLHVVLTSFFRAFFESRYIFHLYPLLVMIAAWVSLDVAARAWRAARVGGGILWAPAAVAVGLLILLFLEDANPADAHAIGDRTYRSEKDPLRSVISWAPYAGFHQDRKTPSLYVRSHLEPGDKVVGIGPPHTIGVYHFYLEPLGYALGRSGDRSYYREVGGKVVSWVTASEILEDPAAVESLRSKGRGVVWLLLDRLLLAEDNRYYPESAKDYLRSISEDPDYVGLDGQTIAVKLTGSDADPSEISSVRRGT
jgi:hypothetical protein